MAATANGFGDDFDLRSPAGLVEFTPQGGELEAHMRQPDFIQDSAFKLPAGSRPSSSSPASSGWRHSDFSAGDKPRQRFLTTTETATKITGGEKMTDCEGGKGQEKGS